MAGQTAEQLGIKAPAGGFQEGGWYPGASGGSFNYDAASGTFGDTNQIWSKALGGAGQQVSPEVRAQSATAQGVTPTQLDNWLFGIKSNAGAGGGLAGGAGGAGDSEASGASGIGASIGQNGPINLQNIYDEAYKGAGITQLQDQYNVLQTELDTKKQALADAKANINENPFYTEANRTGRIAKLEADAQNDMNVIIGKQQALQNQIVSAKADVDTKLNIATKQFDINSAATTQALNQFNTLLSAGALDNASSADLAQFAVATGIPTSMINSAVKLSQQKNTETQMIQTTDDYGNVRVSLVQIKDGQMEVVSQKNLGAIAGTSGSGKLSATEQTQQIATQLAADAASGVPLIDYAGGSDILKIYGPFLDPNTIYNIYNANSKYGPAKESLSQLAAFGVKDINKDPFNIYPAAAK